MLGPTIRNEDGEDVRLTQQYEKVIGMMNGVDHPLVNEHRKQIFGEVYIVGAPDRYWELDVISKLPGGIVEWEAMNEYQQTERIAHRQLQSLMDAVLLELRVRRQNEREENRASQSEKGRS